MNTINGEFIDVAQLRELGVNCGGEDIKVHKSVVVIAPERLTLGDHVRIDPFCIISATGGIRIGRYVHIGAHSSLIGAGGIEMEDFANTSHGVKIFSAADNVAGDYLTGPTVPEELRSVSKAPVLLKRHAGVAVGAVIMPGVVVEEGGLVGTMSFVRKRIPAWSVWAGVPARRVGPRRRGLVELGESLLGASPGSKA